MIFRTEDDEDTAEAFQGEPPHPVRSTSMENHRSHFNGGEFEDRPGMFKRVIIRLLRNSLWMESHGTIRPGD